MSVISGHSEAQAYIVHHVAIWKGGAGCQSRRVITVHPATEGDGPEETRVYPTVFVLREREREREREKGEGGGGGGDIVTAAIFYAVGVYRTSMKGRPAVPPRPELTPLLRRLSFAGPEGLRQRPIQPGGHVAAA